MSLFGETPPTRPRRRVRRVLAGLAVAVLLSAAAYLAAIRVAEPRRPETTVGKRASPGPRRMATPRPTPEPQRAPPRPVRPQTASLRVETDVSGASVFVDRRFVGTAPLEVRDLEPGRHRLNVSADGHELYAEDLELGPGRRTVEVRFEEVRLDESLEVVHRHSFGSCSGRLVASPAGLSYEAAEGGDRFAAPLTSLEQLEVDYLKKNLRVKVRGKTYNFGGESADALFTFHKRVDAARKRLAAR